MKNGNSPEQVVSEGIAGSLAVLLDSAVACHQQGKLAEAQKLYEQILQQNPGHFDALHLLGVISAQARRFAEAEELISRALRVNPNVAEAHSNYGNALKELQRLEEAIASYDRAIALKPDFAEAYTNRGTALSGLKRLEEALANHDKAILLKPEYADAHSNRGNALKELGRLEESVVSYDRAIALKPDHAEAYRRRGVVLQELKQPEEALASYDKAIALRPDYVEANFNRGTTFQELRRLEEALADYDKAIALKPDYAEAYNNRGTALSALKQPEAALASYDKAIVLKPDYAEAYCNRGNALEELQRLEEALASHDTAILLRPDFAEAYSNRGNTLRELKRLEEALANYDSAIALRPGYAEAHGNRGAALKELKRLDEAIVSYDQGIALKPDFANAYFGKALALLLRGDFSSGWRCYEWRKLKDEPLGNREYSQPLWVGTEPVSGKRILVHWEQGLGDTLQFCRYVPLLEQAGAKVLFAPQKPLKCLMRSLGPSFDIVDENDPALAFDFHCPLLSLPLAFNTDLSSVPNRIPYLSVEDARIERWKERIGGHGFRIGICWQGGTTKIDAGRSLPLSAFGSISRLPGVRLISLHKGAGEAQLQSLAEGMKVETLGSEFDAGPDAFLDSAAVMKCCDLVITSDTAIAHLAGALAVPVWIALKYVPDWRWMLERSDSPWYPTAKLFRQCRHDDWAGVFAEIEKELGALMTDKNAEEQVTSGLPRSPRIPVSWGELVDKLTILEIKSTKLTRVEALSNVRRELHQLSPIVERLIVDNAELADLKVRLRRVNEVLWDIEDRIREKEAAQQFDQEFIEFARSVYKRNDERATIKRDINILLSSDLMEEKKYSSY